MAVPAGRGDTIHDSRNIFRISISELSDGNRIMFLDFYYAGIRIHISQSPGQGNKHLGQGAYPIYILHMIFLYLGCYLIFPLEMPAVLKFILVVVFTATGCFAMYELIIRRVRFLRPLFGLKSLGGVKK